MQENDRSREIPPDHFGGDSSGNAISPPTSPTPRPSLPKQYPFAPPESKPRTPIASGGLETPSPTTPPPARDVRSAPSASSPSPPSPHPPTTPGFVNAAAEVGIDALGQLPASYPDETTAKAALERLRDETPKIPSAYRPSGRMPTSAVRMMAAGVFAGGFAGWIGSILTALLGAVIVFLLMALAAGVVTCLRNQLVSSCTSGLALLVAGLIALGFAFLTPLVGGLTAGIVVAQMGRAGKNRSIGGAKGFAAAAGLLAFLLLVGLFVFTKEEIYLRTQPMVEERFELARETSAADADRKDPELPGLCAGCLWIFALLGAAISVAGAVERAGAGTAEAKFCEPCNLHMEHRELGRLTVGATRLLARKLPLGHLELLVEALSVAKGDDGKADLFNCPSCGRGYLELSLEFAAKYKANNQELDLKDNWRAASVALTPREVLRLRSACPPSSSQTPAVADGDDSANAGPHAPTS